MTNKIQNQDRATEIYDELMESLGVPELKHDVIDSAEDTLKGLSSIDAAAKREQWEAALEEADRILKLEALGMEYAKHIESKKERSASLQKEEQERSKDIKAAESQLDLPDEPQS